MRFILRLTNHRTRTPPSMRRWCKMLGGSKWSIMSQNWLPLKAIYCLAKAVWEHRIFGEIIEYLGFVEIVDQPQLARRMTVTRPSDLAKTAQRSLKLIFAQTTWRRRIRITQLTYSNQKSTTTSHHHVLTQGWHEQIHWVSLQDCFNMTKCPPYQPLKVIAHGKNSLAKDLITQTGKRYPQLVKQTLQTS
jgi:hypothetical protein